MILVMSTVNFLIYLAMFFGFEFFIKKRAQRPEVFFIAAEERWYKVLTLVLGASVYALDVIAKDASFFVYAVLFLSYTFTFKEIGSAGIVNNLRRIPLKELIDISLEEKQHGYFVRYKLKNRTYEMIVRKSLAQGLDEAVAKVKNLI